MNFDEDDSAAGKGTLRPLVGQRIHLTEVGQYNLDGFRLSWSADNTARVSAIEPPEIPNAVRCHKWATCRVAEFCCAGKPHAPDGGKAERCFDHKPSIDGGVLVWDVPVKANKDAVEAGNSLHPTLGYPVGCVVKHCGWKIPRAGSWRYGLVLAHRDDVCCLQIDFGSYTAWVNPHAMMHLIRVDNTQIQRAP